MEISIKVSINSILEKVKEFLKQMMENYMKEDGRIIRCMVEVEKTLAMENAF